MNKILIVAAATGSIVVSFLASPANAETVIVALSDFFSQPFGVVGAVCIMLAVTAINSQWLRSRFGTSEVFTGYIFNGLNLVGGTCLFVNAVLRSEVVWLVLETYFVLVAVKGLTQLQRTANGKPGLAASSSGPEGRWSSEQVTEPFRQEPVVAFGAEPHGHRLGPVGHDPELRVGTPAP